MLTTFEFLFLNGEYLSRERDGWVDCLLRYGKKFLIRLFSEDYYWNLEGLKIYGRLLNLMEGCLEGRKMKAILIDKVSLWKKVLSRIPHGLVLDPIMFLIHVNGMLDGLCSYINLLANAKKFSFITTYTYVFVYHIFFLKKYNFLNRITWYCLDIEVVWTRKFHEFKTELKTDMETKHVLNWNSIHYK